MPSRANDDYPVTIGGQVSWYPKAERWRIEVTDRKRCFLALVDSDRVPVL
jgi:hypothetical protein